jgi:hypothetical protein
VQISPKFVVCRSGTRSNTSGGWLMLSTFNQTVKQKKSRNRNRI